VTRAGGALSATLAYAITPRLEGIVRAWTTSTTPRTAVACWATATTTASTASAAAGWPMAVSPRAKAQGSNRYALSLGMSYRVDENSTFKVEYRLDSASQPGLQQRRGHQLQQDQPPAGRFDGGQLLIHGH
jgi:hypothetical protein